MLLSSKKKKIRSNAIKHVFPFWTFKYAPEFITTYPHYFSKHLTKIDKCQLPDKLKECKKFGWIFVVQTYTYWHFICLSIFSFITVKHPSIYIYIYIYMMPELPSIYADKRTSDVKRSRPNFIHIYFYSTWCLYI